MPVPDAPQPVSLVEPTQRTVFHIWEHLAGNGGFPILEYQTGWGLSPTLPTLFLSHAHRALNQATGLSPGAKYYFWSRVRNSVGWSPYSARTEVTLIAGAKVKVGTSWRRAVPYVRDAGVWKVAKPYVKAWGLWRNVRD